MFDVFASVFFQNIFVGENLLRALFWIDFGVDLENRFWNHFLYFGDITFGIILDAILNAISGTILMSLLVPPSCLHY